jgi:hypothetical protein
MAFLGGAVIAALGLVATLVTIRTRGRRHVEMLQAQASETAAAGEQAEAHARA